MPAFRLSGCAKPARGAAPTVMSWPAFGWRVGKMVGKRSRAVRGEGLKGGRAVRGEGLKGGRAVR
eukprot:363906-Chlamydomonas_euryale.AAC.6